MKTRVLFLSTHNSCRSQMAEGLFVFSPHLVTRNVVTATTGVVSAATAGGVKRFVLCSSMARYGTNEVPFTEDMGLASINNR
ncbi:MAG: hypothetical protein AB7D06_02445 [Pedobacter sp.]